MTTIETDFDLVLTTSGEGQQSISRTFEVEAGHRSVTVRFRFITSEVPGGWFGSEFNDFYNVAIRTLNGGGSIVQGNSMNGLGLAAFDADGATGWYEAELPIDADGDTVQVDVAVANVADGLFAPGVETVTLHASPNQGWQFLGWSGGCASAASETTVMMNADISCTASFSRIPDLFLLTMVVEGQGTVTGAPAGIACPPTCSVLYPAETNVTLNSAAGFGLDGVAVARRLRGARRADQSDRHGRGQAVPRPLHRSIPLPGCGVYALH